MWQWLKNQYHLACSFTANAYYRFPSRHLVVIGITGTSGKTTTTHMIYHMLKAAGFKASMLSTITAVVGEKMYDTGFHVTTPDPFKLPFFLSQAVQNGDSHFVLEVSSHGLDQNRAAFIDFEIGVLTTLAHEHLDYHKTFENYAKAKFKLLIQSKYVVIPATGIPSEVYSYPAFKKIEKKAVTFGVEKGEQNQNKWNLKLQMQGAFNIKNALAAASVGNLMDIPIVTIRESLANFKGLAGRFEEIANNRGFKVIIDFAHKPDALESLLISAQEEVQKKGKIIVLYGCAAERDILKRSLMGEISGHMAQVSILTDEDPRFETPMHIIDQIAVGCIKAGAREISPQSFDANYKNHVFVKIPNRKKAINFVINIAARPGDIIIFCGKGHETSMNYKGKELPWSEHKAIDEALENRR